MRYPNVTWHISIALLIYHWTTTQLYFSNIFWVTRTCYISNWRIDVGLRKVPCESSFSVFLAYTSLLSLVSWFIQEAQLTQRDREHTTSWNRVKCCTHVRRIIFEKASNLWMTFKVIQGHCRCCHLIGHIRFPISLPLYVYLCLTSFSRY